MIVYVESNFVLELAFLQEEHESCSAILGLSESGKIRLVLPAFSIGEPYEAWVRRSKQRRDLHEQLRMAIHELSRSGPYHEASDEFRELTNLLIRSGEEEKHRLDDALEKILQNVEIIPAFTRMKRGFAGQSKDVDLDIIRNAITFQKSLDLSPQDSIVYASLLAHLTTESGELRCFITKNYKDFANPDIEDQLTAHGCKLLTKFVNGLGYIRSQL